MKTQKQNEPQLSAQMEKRQQKEYVLPPFDVHINFPENLDKNLKISSSCGGSQDCGSANCSKHSKQERK